ncbi:hypothetical protein SMGD1_2802 [Sulfurimonas gotlandica GD1]|uniref:Uncharacterized protein n=1 Tax=Sulfurimonas gotlandica (strain DSM 19862 / JCM 16533 / GD1) TaxID=929558 RepID=H1FU18_SULGG|nr:hypothetical protein [Sulfurimonas gotlandica]EHP31324.1 hypothetical protein SMGD1_2802 [Sulfurimonas gotlandica GD1]
MKDDEILIRPEKLQALKKHLQLRLGRRKKARELLLPQEKSNFVDKMKNVFNTYQ